ncbi:GH18 domain-containing protein [Plasmodiophora brassicae]|uniref:GH18 domain-containing protein n=1 Tax=Plasmodiophora brassicae TaxID=37360 RepID=A0A0G4INW4_PLABS|nr:hypothetical protein PBRA_005464 [Plasmodiophora brassicae]
MASALVVVAAVVVLVATVADGGAPTTRLNLNNPTLDPTIPNTPPVTTGIVAAFFTNQAPFPATNIPAGLLTHLIYSFANVNTDCSIFTMYPADLDPNNPFSYAQVLATVRKANPNIKVMLSFGGDTQNVDPKTCPAFTACVATQATRATFIGNMLAWVRQHGFDGIDLDWESPGVPLKCGVPDDKPNFVSLLREMQAQIRADVANGKPDLLVSLSLISSPSYIQEGLDLANLHYYVNFINLQFYEMTLGDLKKTEPHTALQGNQVGMSMVESLKMFNALPANKIVAGVGFFSKAYRLAAGTPCAYNQADLGFDLGAELAYHQIVDLLAANPQIAVTHDAATTTTFFCTTAGDGTRVLHSYSTADDLQQDINFFLVQGLAGTNIWTVNHDVQPGFPLTSMLAKSMVRNRSTTTTTPAPTMGAQPTQAPPPQQGSVAGSAPTSGATPAPTAAADTSEHPGTETIVTAALLTLAAFANAV